MNRLDEIRAYKARKDEEENLKTTREHIENETLQAEIRKIDWRIKDLIETANVAIENDINIDDFTTDGIRHSLGFFVAKNGKINKMVVNSIGYRMGGYFGPLDFHTDGDKVYSLTEGRGAIEKPRTNHMKRFLAEIDEFEARFYAYIDFTVMSNKREEE